MPYRLLEYMVGIWRDVLKNTETKVFERKDYRLPAIVPIIIYNGAGRWTACRNFKETLAEAEQFGEYLVDFKYILIDVNRYNKKVLLELSNIIGTVFLLDQSITREEYLNSEEVEQVVSNMEQTLRKMYEDAKTAGVMEGEEKIVKNMLTKNMDEKLISEIRGFPIEKIRDLKKELNQVH